MKKPLIPSLLLAAAVSALPVASLHAAANATDNANNSAYGTTYDGLNGGTGFGANTLSNNGVGGYGSFIDTAANNANGSGGGIDTNGRSFGLYANNGGLVQDTRSFTAGGSNASTALAAGQTFSLGLDNGYIATNSTVGFNLLNAAGTSQFTFEFVGGNSTGDYSYGVGSGAQIDTGVSYTPNGLNISVALGAGNAFTLTVAPIGGTAVTINNNFATGASISQFQVFDNNATGTDTTNGSNYNLFFNSPTVVPEPGTWAASLTGIGLLVGMQRLRRRRA